MSIATPIAPLTTTHQATSADDSFASSYDSFLARGHDADLVADYSLVARADGLWTESDNWRLTVEDIVDAVLLRVAAIELSKVRSTWR
jgi:hypothetical protein